MLCEVCVFSHSQEILVHSHMQCLTWTIFTEGDKGTVKRFDHIMTLDGHDEVRLGIARNISLTRAFSNGLSHIVANRPSNGRLKN